MFKVTKNGTLKIEIENELFSFEYTSSSQSKSCFSFLTLRFTKPVLKVYSFSLTQKSTPIKKLLESILNLHKHKIWRINNNV
jgi:hypothetical protein